MENEHPMQPPSVGIQPHEPHETTESQEYRQHPSPHRQERGHLTSHTTKEEQTTTEQIPPRLPIDSSLSYPHPSHSCPNYHHVACQVLQTQVPTICNFHQDNFHSGQHGHPNNVCSILGDTGIICNSECSPVKGRNCTSAYANQSPETIPTNPQELAPRPRATTQSEQSDYRNDLDQLATRVNQLMIHRLKTPSTKTSEAIGSKGPSTDAVIPSKKEVIEPLSPSDTTTNSGATKPSTGEAPWEGEEDTVTDPPYAYELEPNCTQVQQNKKVIQALESSQRRQTFHQHIQRELDAAARKKAQDEEISLSRAKKRYDQEARVMENRISRIREDQQRSYNSMMAHQEAVAQHKYHKVIKDALQEQREMLHEARIRSQEEAIRHQTAFDSKAASKRNFITDQYRMVEEEMAQQAADCVTAQKAQTEVLRKVEQKLRAKIQEQQRQLNSQMQAQLQGNFLF
ncbi:hypothetical protein Pelo_5104 [Pelomyxa schiedti]|nr:hypothetical protein Pelo_5104 [Pelomyxa schiedti]